MEKKAANRGAGWGKVCFLPEPWFGGRSNVSHSKARVGGRSHVPTAFFKKLFTFIPSYNAEA